MRKISREEQSLRRSKRGRQGKIKSRLKKCWESGRIR